MAVATAHTGAAAGVGALNLGIDGEGVGAWRAGSGQGGTEQIVAASGWGSGKGAEWIAAASG